MPTLHDRLADLADDVSDVVPPRGLWAAEQRRRGALRRYTLVVVAATLALVGMLLGAAWQAAQPPAPASPRGEVGLPDRIYVPSRWLRTAEGGELGRLVALRTQGRGGWWGERPGVVGLSAETGEYAFLDLPDLADEDVSLSPDGRYVAYWTTGRPPAASGPAITGVSVYDVATGDVRHAELSTDRGLRVDGGVFFVDDDTLILSSSEIINEAESMGNPACCGISLAPGPRRQRWATRLIRTP